MTKRILAITSLAFGIGLNVLIFGFTSPALFKGLPYPDADRLVDLTMVKADKKNPLTPPLYFWLRDKTATVFDAVGVFDAGQTANIAGDAVGPADHVAGHRITATGLAALGTKPLFGRLPAVADETAEVPTMVLSYPLWQRRFAGHQDVVNQTVPVDGQPTQIIGVMPEGFGLLDNSSDAWFTYSFEPTPAQASQHSLRGIGRLKPGVSLADAQAATKAALDGYTQQFPTRDPGWTVELTPWREARFGGLRKPLLYALVGVGAMLLLLCVNLSLMLLSRTGRAGLKESVLVSIGGGVVGTALAAFVLPRLVAMVPKVLPLPRLDEVGIGGTALAFAAVLSVITGLVYGIVPAMRGDQATGKVPATGAAWAGATVFVVLLTVQMALAFLLVAASGFGFRAVGDLTSKDIGINPAGLLSADVYLPRAPYMAVSSDAPGMADFTPAGPALYDRIRASIQTMPGVVQAAGVAGSARPPFDLYAVQYVAADAPDNQLPAQYVTVTENYFNTVGVRIVKGRDFAATDQPDSPWVVLVNETLAKQSWPGADPIGQKLTLGAQGGDDEPAREVVGVVADTLAFPGAKEIKPLVYVLHRQQAASQRYPQSELRRMKMSFFVKAQGDPVALGTAMRARVGTVDLTTPVTDIHTVEWYLDNAGQVAIWKFVSPLLGVLGVVALVIALTGVYAFTARGVSRGRAGGGLVLRAAVAVVAGIAVGYVVWGKLAGILASFLTNLTVSPSDPATLAGVAGMLVVTALVACLMGAAKPARRG